jgi:hypothetical protein
MKVTKIEKVIMVLIVVLVIGISASFSHLAKTIDNAGGMRQIIIEAGKEMNRIGDEINEGE